MRGLVRWVRDSPNSGKLMLLLGVLVLVPLTVLPFYPAELRFAPSFLAAAGVSVGTGLLVCALGHGHTDDEDWRTTLTRSSWTVIFIWLWGSFVGALPFWLGLGMSPLHAAFESVSGWSTTGLSVIDVSKTPQVFMFHRCFMQYCGALGIVLMMILVMSNRESMNLYDAEGHPDKILPSLSHTARAIFFIYNLCLVAGVVAYMVAGLSFFDSLYHAMCALSTGGFSNKLGSVGEFDSVPVEAITIVLMLVGATNFATLILMAQGRVRRALRTSELRFMGIVVLASTLLLSANLAGNGFSVAEGLRQGLFASVTAMSTCGFSTSDYASWPPLAIGVVTLVMFVGGGYGSTSGGLKLRRAYLALRVMGQEVRRRFSPRNRVSSPTFFTAQGPAPIDAPLVSNTFGLLMIYLATFLAGSFALTVTSGFDLASCMFEYASSLSGVGLTVGVTSPTASAATLVIEMVGMLIGRLEIVVVFVALGSGWESVKDALRRRGRKARA